MIPFRSSGHLTLGVEIELQLLDPDTLDLKPSATAVLELTKQTDRVKPEIFQSMVEINTGVCENVHEIERDLKTTMEVLKYATHKVGVLVATTGTHPFARYTERKLFDAQRYQQLIDRNQWIARRLMIFGLHVHLGMKDGDTCIRFNNFFLHMLPQLIALTTSSPYWQGEDTGLSSCRNTIFEACPTAGHPCRMLNWFDFSELCRKLTNSGSIGSHKDLWWDIRPSPEFGTLEIRVCDGLATLSETLAITAFIHALAHWYNEHAGYNVEMHAPYMWMMRENKWRATRYGLDAYIINDGEANVVPLRKDVMDWLDLLAPKMRQLGYERHIEHLFAIARCGTSTDRQRQVFAETQSLTEVVRFNVMEYERQMPVWS